MTIKKVKNGGDKKILISLSMWVVYKKTLRTSELGGVELFRAELSLKALIRTNTLCIRYCRHKVENLTFKKVGKKLNFYIIKLLV